MSCGKMSEQTVPCGCFNANSKTVKIRCGHTGNDGIEHLCLNCLDKNVERQPVYEEECSLDCED
tara:strand:+ start:275 stop:466 length:192 start_codon:yes stop_codon:yes gene_type:complete